MVRQNRKGNNLKWKNNLFVGVLAVGLASPAIAQQTNTLEIIKELQRRIEELENKVQSLERGQTKEAPPRAPPPYLWAAMVSWSVRETPIS